MNQDTLAAAIIAASCWIAALVIAFGQRSEK